MNLALTYNNNTSLTANFQDNQVSQYQDVSILDVVRAKDDGGSGEKKNVFN